MIVSLVDVIRTAWHGGAGIEPMELFYLGLGTSRAMNQNRLPSFVGPLSLVFSYSVRTLATTGGFQEPTSKSLCRYCCSSTSQSWADLGQGNWPAASAGTADPRS